MTHATLWKTLSGDCFDFISTDYFSINCKKRWFYVAWGTHWQLCDNLFIYVSNTKLTIFLCVCNSLQLICCKTSSLQFIQQPEVKIYENSQEHLPKYIFEPYRRSQIGNVFENLQTSSYENTATVSFMTETLLQLFILNRQPCVRIQNILVQSNSQFRADLFTVNKFCSSHFPPPFPACLCHSAHWLKLVWKVVMNIDS